MRTYNRDRMNQTYRAIALAENPLELQVQQYIEFRSLEVTELG